MKSFKVTTPPKLRENADKKVVLGPEHGFRPGTEVTTAPMYFFLNAGGVGDYINYMAAILWNAANLPWLHGTVFVSSFLVEFCSYLLKPFPNWKCLSGERVQMETDVCFAGPELKLGTGQVINHQLLNATGAHLTTLGFAYYSNMTPAPADATLPYVSFPLKRVRFELRDKVGKYVVFTPGAVTPARATYGRHLNPLIEWVVSQGYLPVFLGKSEVTPDLDPVFADDIAWGLGLDLRNKTTIMEAAAILQYSAAVVGLDNGLLHLAACTDANVVFAYNIVGPKNRAPRRHPSVKGGTWHINLTDRDLHCNNCQDKWKLLINHNFHSCYYVDKGVDKQPKCVDMLFADGAARFKGALTEAFARGQT